MTQKVALITSRQAPDLSVVEAPMIGLDYELTVSHCESDGETIEAVKGADVVIDHVVPLPKEVIDEMDTAKAIVSFGHGFDYIDDDAASENGIMLVNTAGFCTEEVSNHAILGLLAGAKKLTQLNERVKSGVWDMASVGPFPPIDGQVLGLVGLGNIGRATARKAKVFGLETIAYDPFVQPWVAKEYRVELVDDLNELASRSDFVSMHTPLNKGTYKMLGESFFQAMKPTAWFINTCRGKTVDEAALVAALKAGEIAGAALDVFEAEPTPADNPLLGIDNVIVTPHSAGFSTVSNMHALEQVGEETSRILQGQRPMALVNPAVGS